jgi:hypothetical protein
LPGTRQRAFLVTLINRVDVGADQIDIHLRPAGSPRSSMSQPPHCRARQTTKFKSCPRRYGYAAPGGRSGC